MEVKDWTDLCQPELAGRFAMANPSYSGGAFTTLVGLTGTPGLGWELYEAMKANDFRTLQFLDWFVKEQGEEEKNASDLLGRFDLFASDVKGLYALDSEMGARTYTAPSLTL